ncbi:unnamed protein product [Tenebrio molitor]|nr:unnamed protein product [Tenebrio molitor]
MSKPCKQRYGKKSSNKFFKSRFKGKSNNLSNSQSHKEYQHQDQFQEVDVGITEFISKFDGYSGVIKARFSDFQVNEIDLNGDVAKLTDLQIPADFQSKEEAVDGGEEVPVDTPLSQIPQKTWDAIKQMIESSEAREVELNAEETTKEEREKIHECLKKVFARKIVCNTGTKDGIRTMIFKKYSGKNSDRRFKWPKDKGEYVHFLVYKECLDTLETTLKVATCLKMSPSHLTYAGVKDKRAKTTQWFSIKKVEPWKLIVKTRPLKNVRIGNITFKDKPLKLGELVGNKFRIALRNVTGDDDLIEKSLQSLKENGFINYYGLQRFGNDKEVPTFSIGVQLLLGNWKEACQIILKPTKADQPDFDISKAKKVYAETGDAAKALEQFDGSRNTCIEFLLLSGLSKGHANDFVNALTSIPRNTRLLYIHSFQSLIWNLVASKRIEKFGLQVVEGDLVLLEDCNDEAVCDDSEEDTSDRKRTKVKALTSDECSNYTIYDVVLPLPGYDIEYPENLKDFYKETLEKYGLTLEMTKQTVQTYSLSGTYRKLLERVQDLSWKIMHYNDPHYNLIRSDLEELKGLDEPEDVKDGTYKALVLEFCLNSSSYATMVLREILKTDTSSSSHAKLNSYHTVAQEKKKILVEDDASNGEDADEDLDDRIGLLSDKQRYEAFKNIVFNMGSSSLKRKHEDSNQNENSKIAKTTDESS